MVSCPNCSKELPDNAKFCMQCGTQVAFPKPQPVDPSPRYCSNLQCEAELPDEALFCLLCGIPVVDKEPELQADETIKDDLYKRSTAWLRREYQHTHGDYVEEIFDPERFVESIRRGVKWAEYYISCMRKKDWFYVLSHPTEFTNYMYGMWSTESQWFYTNNNLLYKKLVCKEFLRWFWQMANSRGYIDSENQPSADLLNYLRRVLIWDSGKRPEDWRFRFPDNVIKDFIDEKWGNFCNMKIEKE